MSKEELSLHGSSAMKEYFDLTKEIGERYIEDKEKKEAAQLAFRFAVATFRFNFHGARLLQAEEVSESLEKLDFPEEIEEFLGSTGDAANYLASQRELMLTVIQAAQQGDYRLLKRFTSQEGMSRLGKVEIEWSGELAVISPFSFSSPGSRLGAKLNRLAYLMPDSGDPLEIPQRTNPQEK